MIDARFDAKPTVRPTTAAILLGGRHFIRSFTHIDPEIARAQAERFIRKLKTHPAQRDTEYVIK